MYSRGIYTAQEHLNVSKQRCTFFVILILLLYLKSAHFVDCPGSQGAWLAVSSAHMALLFE